MFGKAHAAIKRAAESPPVFSGLGSAEWNRGRHLPPKERAFEAVVEIDRDFNRGERGMLGWMMAWDARWLREVGGVPRAVVEDFALGLQAELRGGGREVVDARVWAYSPTRRGDHWKAVTRFTQGAFQQLDRYADDPQAKDLIRKEAAHLLSPRHIISKLTHDLLHSKVGVAKTAYRFAQHVQAFIVGWAMNRSYPDSQTWRQLDTTRLHQKN